MQMTTDEQTDQLLPLSLQTSAGLGQQLAATDLAAATHELRNFETSRLGVPNEAPDPGLPRNQQNKSMLTFAEPLVRVSRSWPPAADSWHSPSGSCSVWLSSTHVYSPAFCCGTGSENHNASSCDKDYHPNTCAPCTSPAKLVVLVGPGRHSTCHVAVKWEGEGEGEFL